MAQRGSLRPHPPYVDKPKRKARWHVYLLECKDKSLYTGATTDVERRFREHQNKAAHYTSYNPPVRVVYQESFRTKSAALKREAQIKRLSRKKKLALIQ